MVPQLAVATIVKPVTLSSTGAVGMCPSHEERQNVIQNITASVQAILKESIDLTTFCGEGEWYISSRQSKHERFFTAVSISLERVQQ